MQTLLTINITIDYDQYDDSDHKVELLMDKIILEHKASWQDALGDAIQAMMDEDTCYEVNDICVELDKSIIYINEQSEEF